MQKCKLPIGISINVTTLLALVLTIALQVVVSQAASAKGFVFVGGKHAPAPVTPVGSINVKSYGATGNGVSDDSAAINQGLAQAKAMHAALYFPLGNYVFGSNLNDDSAVMFCAAGTRLVSINGAVLVVTGNGPTVRGFTIISVGGTSPTTLVYVTNAENFFIGYNIFNGPADVDLQVRYSSYGNVVFNNFVRADNTNAYAIGSSFVHYSNNVFGQGAVIGFEFDLGGTQFGNFLANNYFAGNNGQSIIVLGLQGSLISQNQIANAIGCGIGLFATGNSINNIRVTSNSINGGSQGFCFYGIEDTTFDGNVVTNSQLAAFQDLGGGSGYLNIASNFIRNAGIDSVAPLPAELAAIYVSNSPYSSVNVINNVYQGGAFKLNFYVDSHFVGATVSGDTASIALPNLI